MFCNTRRSWLFRIFKSLKLIGRRFIAIMMEWKKKNTLNIIALTVSKKRIIALMQGVEAGYPRHQHGARSGSRVSVTSAWRKEWKQGLRDISMAQGVEARSPRHQHGARSGSWISASSAWPHHKYPEYPRFKSKLQEKSRLKDQMQCFSMQVFSPKPWKKLAQIRLVVFEKNGAKTA